MNALVAAVLRALAPVFVQEARRFLASDDGRKFVADVKAMLMDVVTTQIATAEPLHTDEYLAGKPGVGIDGAPLP